MGLSALKCHTWEIGANVQLARTRWHSQTVSKCCSESFLTSSCSHSFANSDKHRCWFILEDNELFRWQLNPWVCLARKWTALLKREVTVTVWILHWSGSFPGDPQPGQNWSQLLPEKVRKTRVCNMLMFLCVCLVRSMDCLSGPNSIPMFWWIYTEATGRQIHPNCTNVLV